MDPNAPQLSPAPVTPDRTPPPDMSVPKRRRFSWPPSKKQIILAIAALLLLGIISIFVVNTLRYSSGGSGPDLANVKPGDINGPYYEREGYPRQQIGPLIGDAMALEMRQNNRPAKAGDTAIFPACAILTLSDVRKAGLHTNAAATDQSGVQMIYVDGKGSAPLPYDRSMLLNETNKCTYQLESTPGQANSVAISAYQAFQASAVAIREEVSIKYEQAAPIAGVDGVQLFTLRSAQGGRDTTANTTEYYIAKGTQVVLRLRLQYAGSDRQAKIESLVKTALANIDALAATPQGAPTPTYKDSPTYKQDHLRACSLLNDAALQTMGVKQAAAAVRENLSNSTGVVQFADQKDDALYLYVLNSCERDGAGSEDNASVQVTTYSFLNSKGAERQLADLKSRSRQSQTVSGVGDEAVASSGAIGLGGQLLFRQGRYVVAIGYSAPNQSPTETVDLNTYAKTVAPLAGYISKQIKQ